jgi:hypothetical protein
MSLREITYIGNGAGYFDDRPDRSSFKILESRFDQADDLNGHLLYAYIADRQPMDHYRAMCKEAVTNPSSNKLAEFLRIIAEDTEIDSTL